MDLVQFARSSDAVPRVVMADQKWMAKTVYFPALVLACFIIGSMIPTFYDWSGADQSYSTPALDQMIWSLISFGCLAWLVIPWLPMKDAPTENAPEENATTKSEPKRFQFNLYSLLVLTTIIAILFAVVANQSVVICILIWVVAYVSTVRMVVKHLSWKWQFSALLACMYLPFAWVVFSRAFKTLDAEHILGAVGLPSLVPVTFLSRMVHPSEIVWLWILMTAIEVAIGIWLIRKSPKCTIAYFVLVMLMSAYGSMFFNMGIRI